MKNVIFALFAFFCFSKIFCVDWNEITIKKNGDIFAGADCEFSIDFPNEMPADVRVTLPTLPEDVRLVSQKRFVVSDDVFGRRTQIRFVLTFLRAGTFFLNPILAEVGDEKNEIDFGEIEVLEDLSKIVPEIFVKIDDEATCGKSARLCVFARCASQILHFSYKLSKDSLLKEKKRFFSDDVLPFSNDEILLAEFDWTPLVSGYCALPEFFLDAMTFGGEKCSISFSREKIFVRAENQKIDTKSNDSVFENAFGEAFSFSNLDEKNQTDAISIETVQKIASLRSEERHAFFGGEARKNRRELEKSLEIFGKDEPSEKNARLFLICGGAIFVLAVLFFVARKKKIGAFFSAFSLFFLAAFLFENYRVHSSCGIFAGGKIFLIPESNGEGEAILKSGERVFLKKRAGEWIYIQGNEGGGWVLQNAVVPIR